MFLRCICISSRPSSSLDLGKDGWLCAIRSANWIDPGCPSKRSRKRYSHNPIGKELWVAVNGDDHHLKMMLELEEDARGVPSVKDNVCNKIPTKMRRCMTFEDDDFGECTAAKHVLNTGSKRILRFYRGAHLDQRMVLATFHSASHGFCGAFLIIAKSHEKASLFVLAPFPIHSIANCF